MKHPSPSLVISCIALFVALGGTGIAASTLIRSSSQIRTGVVNSGDVRNNSLTGSDIKQGSIAAGDLKRGVLTGANIKDGAITDDELSAGVRNTLRGSGLTSTELVRRSGPVVGAGGSSPVATLRQVSPGTYAVFAKTTLESTRASQGLGDAVRDPGAVGAVCKLDFGSEIDQARHEIASRSGQTPATLNMQLTRTIDAPTDVRLDCTADGSPWRAADTSIVILKLNGATRQDSAG